MERAAAAAMVLPSPQPVLPPADDTEDEEGDQSADSIMASMIWNTVKANKTAAKGAVVSNLAHQAALAPTSPTDVLSPVSVKLRTLRHCDKESGTPLPVHIAARCHRTGFVRRRATAASLDLPTACSPPPPPPSNAWEPKNNEPPSTAFAGNSQGGSELEMPSPPKDPTTPLTPSIPPTTTTPPPTPHHGSGRPLMVRSLSDKMLCSPTTLALSRLQRRAGRFVTERITPRSLLERPFGQS